MSQTQERRTATVLARSGKDRYRHGMRKFTPRTPGSTWIAFDPAMVLTLPDLPAVYVIFLDGVLAYVGETQSLQKRFGHYEFKLGYGNETLTKWGEFGLVIVKAGMSRRFGDWKYREARLIRRLRPRFNQLGKGGRG